MNKYIIILIILFIFLLVMFITNDQKKMFVVSENNIIKNEMIKNDIYIPISVEIKINNDKIKCIPIYINKNTIKVIFLNFIGREKKIIISIDNIKKILLIKPFYSSVNISDEKFNFIPKTYKNISIPKTIMQTSKSRYVTNNKYLSIHSIIDNNPNYNIHN
jgi:hypothetical protein